MCAQHRVLRESVSLLHRYKILKENLHIVRLERDEVKLKLSNSESERAQEKLLEKAKEDSWQTNLEEVQRNHNQYVLVVNFIFSIHISIDVYRKVCESLIIDSIASKHHFGSSRHSPAQYLRSGNETIGAYSVRIYHLFKKESITPSPGTCTRIPSPSLRTPAPTTHKIKWCFTRIHSRIVGVDSSSYTT